MQLARALVAVVVSISFSTLAASADVSRTALVVRGDALARVDLATLAIEERPLGGMIHDAVVSGGEVWVQAEREPSLARFSADTLAPIGSIALAGAPAPLKGDERAGVLFAVAEGRAAIARQRAEAGHLATSLEWLDVASGARASIELPRDAWLEAIASSPGSSTAISVSADAVWTTELREGATSLRIAGDFHGDEGGAMRGVVHDAATSTLHLVARGGTHVEVSLASGRVTSRELELAPVGTKGRGYVESVRASADGRFLAVETLHDDSPGNWPNAISLLDSTWRQVASLNVTADLGPGLSIADFAFSDDGRELVVIATDGTLARWSVPDAKLVASAPKLLPRARWIIGAR